MADHPTEIVGEIQAYYRVRASTDNYATSPDFNLREVENHYLPRWLCDDITVLDAGCGNGYSTLCHAARYRADFAGVDFVPEMILGTSHCLFSGGDQRGKDAMATAVARLVHVGPHGQPVRILLVTAMFPPVATGTSFYSKNLAESLRKRGHEVVVVTVTHPQAAEMGGNFPVYRLRALHVPLKEIFNHFRMTSIFPSNYGLIKEIAHEYRPEVILLVNHYLDIAFPAIFLSRKLGIPLVCSVGTQLQSSNPRHHWVLRVLDRLICGNVVFPFCREVVAWARRFFSTWVTSTGRGLLARRRWSISDRTGMLSHSLRTSTTIHCTIRS